MAKRKLIPFWMWPTAWVLKGKPRREAEAYYYLDGEELERKLAEIAVSDPITGELKDKDKITLQEKNLEIDVKYGKITENEYRKTLASLRKEPWVGCVEDYFDRTQRTSGYFFKLDWNREFIDMLIEEGYSGVSEEDIVQQWFDDVNRAVEEEMVEEEPGDNVLPIRNFHTTKKQQDGDNTIYS